MTIYVGFDDVVWASPACKNHLTQEEHEARQVVQTRIDAARDRMEPACWSWTPPDPGDVVRRINAHPPQIRRYMFPDICAFSEFHDDRCAICGTTGVHLVDDHDHSTGMIRGYLCRGCNVGEGASVLPVFDMYRTRNPATILGVQWPYTGIGWKDGVPVSGWESQGHRGPSSVESLWNSNAVTKLGL